MSAFLALLLLPLVAATPREVRIPVGGASLYSREVGSGRPLIVLHGGPDFDHGYLLPEMDRLADAYRLIYYDQRGRGRSAAGVRPEDVSLASEIADLDEVRRHFGLSSAVIVGHSWGALLALEYALQHPDRVSRLIRMNPAPVSAADLALLRQSRQERAPGDVNRLKEIRKTEGYRRGDPDAVAAYYLVHFRAAMRRPGSVETIVARLRASFTAEGILKARAIEDRLVEQTWGSAGYDLLPKLGRLDIPTLVINGDDVFIPGEVAAHVARAIPKSRLVTLKDCGHFSYLECPDPLRAAIDAFFEAPKAGPS